MIIVVVMVVVPFLLLARFSRTRKLRERGGMDATHVGEEAGKRKKNKKKK